MTENDIQALMRRLPAVHVLVEHADLASAVGEHGREAVTRAARTVLDRARQMIRGGHTDVDDGGLRSRLIADISAHLASRPTLYRRVLNATGVILHTNLGRAPIPEAAWEAMREAVGYCDLELDLATGKRASRLRDIAEPLCAVTGAEAGTVVNNNAAAVLIALSALAGTKPTAISRGHLVEIGGGFRLPTIMEASGSPLLEVGTTNRTHLADYEEAIARGAGMILLVHRSNFVISGYVTEPEPEDVIALGRAHEVPVVLDLGSGALFDTLERGLPAETTVQQAVAQGFDLVCFSGDKLLGGPQAGYIVGSRAVIERVKKHPLARALRCDKLQLSAAVATLDLYRRGEAERLVPIWQMAGSETRSRAEAWCDAIGTGEVVEAAGAVGGGSLPEGTLPGWALALDTDDADALLAALRRQTPPVVGHIVEDRVLLHPRTVPPEMDQELVTSVRSALGSEG